MVGQIVPIKLVSDYIPYVAIEYRSIGHPSIKNPFTSNLVWLYWMLNYRFEYVHRNALSEASLCIKPYYTYTDK